MVKLEKLVLQVMEDGGEVFIKSGDILVIDGYYIDQRTRFDLDKNLHHVKPVMFFNHFHWYVCPDCCKLHVSNILGKIQTGCCLDIDCERHQYFNGTHYFIKRNPILLDEFVTDG